MSNLSTQEVTAGISRKALATVLSRTEAPTNGSGNHRASEAVPNVKINPRTTYGIISAYRETPIVDTPMRRVSILETQDGDIILRDTSWERFRADVTMIRLDYHEAQACAAVLIGLEPEPESKSKPSGKA